MPGAFEAGSAGGALLETPFTDAEIAALFSAGHAVQAMLEAEAALARAQAAFGIIPAAAGQDISARAASFQPDIDRLRAALEQDGVPVIELMRQLQERVGPPHAAHVHFGATTQDIMDTALVLQLREALAILEGRLRAVVRALAALADRYRHVVMAGRTHSQQAVPITFGLKAAGWLAPLLRHQQRLAEIRPRLLVVQLGGAAGTLAPLKDRGPQLQAAFAAELKLGVPLMAWHTQRDSLAELAGWLALVSGSLAKMAQDVILLAQTEVGEVRESAGQTGGRSSTMPQKSNPVISEHIIACARLSADLAASMHQALIQEHERGTHGWQMEWLALPRLLELTAAALRKAESLSTHLAVDEARMRRNVSASNGLMLAEALTFALAESMGRTEAKTLVSQACQIAAAENRHLVDVLKERCDAPLDWGALRQESSHLGSAQAIIDRVIAAAAETGAD